MGFGVLLQEQNREVGRKLGLATLLMFTLPIGAYFVSSEFLFAGKEEPSVWSGAVAVVVTNMIVGGYVYSAFSEEDDEPDERAEGKDQPRVGAFKKRVD